MSSSKRRVFLADDHQILLDGVRTILSRSDDYEVIGQAADGEQALQFLRNNEADIFISDYSLPGLDGLELVRVLKRIRPELKVIILSMHDEPHLVKEILKEGIKGYVLKKDSQKELIEALDQVWAGKIFLSPEINGMLIKSLQFPGENNLLTEREREVLKLIAKELSNRQIAEKLFISERTVETHRKNIFRKTKTNNMVGLIKYAYANNLI